MPSPHATAALQPLRLTRNEAQARTTIAQRAGGLPLRLGTAAWQARLLPMAAASPVEPGPGYVVRLEWAGAAMALSSVSVVSNALLLKRWKAKLPEDDA